MLLSSINHNASARTQKSRLVIDYIPIGTGKTFEYKSSKSGGKFQCEYVKSFRDLEVYKFTRQLSKEIFEVSKRFPKEEMYSLTDQVRRSSRSIGAQTAEAWAKRNMKNILSVN